MCVCVCVCGLCVWNVNYVTGRRLDVAIAQCANTSAVLLTMSTCITPVSSGGAEYILICN